MKTKSTNGFTLIELLVVVVIIGILATIAVPKFAASKDKARLASVRTDLRNIMTSQEAYWADWGTFATFAQLQASTNYTFSTGNSASVSATVSGYTATITNAGITTTLDECTVAVGGGVTSTLDAQIICS